ncbi:MAG: GNAT family N-acetyltransferase [Verrucomicrobiales bacterium]|nr:GNAT family N-acetyltransferase [Verrucomicrobiales bacterium]
MKLNLANKTDLIFYGYHGQVEENDNFIIVKTVRNPKSYLGNQLIFQGTNSDLDINAWKNLYIEKFKDIPQVKHLTLNYEGERDYEEIAELAAKAGCKSAERVILKTAINEFEKRESGEIEILIASTDEDWNELALRASASTGDNLTASHQYFVDHFKIQEQMQKEGLSSWFLGKKDNRVVTSLGLMFLRAEGIGRYQAVSTNKDERGKGYASALLYAAAQSAHQRFEISEFVLVTDEDHPEALRLYKNLGFRDAGKQILIYLWN